LTGDMNDYITYRLEKAKETTPIQSSLLKTKAGTPVLTDCIMLVSIR